MRNPEETRRRLLEAATAEFAAFGIAGARVDRIAETAACNKQSIYGYFGSKEGLFDAVLEAVVVAAVAELPVDANDLPGYAGRMFDWCGERPDVVRLMNWMQLEKGDAMVGSASIAAASAAKLEKVRAAQRAGKVNDTMPAEHLVALVGRLATAQVNDCVLAPAARKALRKSLVDAVRRLVAP